MQKQIKLNKKVFFNMDVICCPKCSSELKFYPDILGDMELNSGVWVCDTPECENFDSEVFNSGDFEYAS